MGGISVYHQGGKGTLPTLGFSMVLVQDTNFFFIGAPGAHGECLLTRCRRCRGVEGLEGVDMFESTCLRRLKRSPWVPF